MGRKEWGPLPTLSEYAKKTRCRPWRTGIPFVIVIVIDSTGLPRERGRYGARRHVSAFPTRDGAAGGRSFGKQACGWGRAGVEEQRCRATAVHKGMLPNIGGTKWMSGNDRRRLDLLEPGEKEYIVGHSVQFPCLDLRAFLEKPVRFVKADGRFVRPKHLEFDSLQSLRVGPIQGCLQ